ncbi:hypothetical protein CHLRE_12g501050v5 [Chlamydomonas reinhardtii]|uniref:Aldehyde dehydrogenase domain-containing protein n=1 Tax=Chlamydomonas reinhardtii TaxID=3055 RepID=A0A2K3D385_CHLRE|nr:uncharacterized protein CHLRE_12g501050v5 [Chlamydomonas reinhardtii]PNW74995.1 hypothetical protein CHLRE_12g501050v5 [Chlamydomonas reinhardtii]
MTVSQDVTAKIDEALKVLTAKKKEWAQLPLEKKVELLDAVRLRLDDQMLTLGRAGARLKGSDEDQNLVVGEMLTSVAVPATYIHRLASSLRQLAASGKVAALPTRTAASGQKVVQVYPVTWSDRNSLLQPGATAELYLRPEQAEVRQGLVYGPDGRVAEHDGRLCAVLGAGNHGFLALKDALVCLYERGEVAAIKPHPAQSEWHRAAEYALQPLIEAGYLRNLYLDSAEDTRALLYHPLVDCVHMTGGTATHDAIVWGSTPEEQARRRAADDPVLKVPITSELGCITPFIIPPWSYTPKQLEAQAADLVVAMTSNVGCNCNSAKVLVLPADWSQADAFMDCLRAALKQTPLDPAYYAGIHSRYDAFKKQYPNCEVVEAPAVKPTRPLSGPPLPYLINVMDKLPAEPHKEYAFNVEPFAPVLTVVRLPTQGVEAFLAESVRFANDDLWGSLSCMIILHPDMEKAHPEACRKAVDDLRFGVVSVNAWSAVSFVTGAVTWGAFAGDQTIKDVRSGLGVVGNPYLVDGVQKAVYRVPIDGEAVPKPPAMKPIPMAAARLIMGFVVDGWRGLVGSFWAK